MPDSQDLKQIPGVGKSIEQDFKQIGINSIKDLTNKDPETLYKKMCAKQGEKLDRCLLYVCKTATYYANNKTHNPEKLKWWNWKD